MECLRIASLALSDEEKRGGLRYQEYIAVKMVATVTHPAELDY